MSSPVLLELADAEQAELVYVSRAMQTMTEGDRAALLVDLLMLMGPGLRRVALEHAFQICGGVAVEQQMSEMQSCKQ